MKRFWSGLLLGMITGWATAWLMDYLRTEQKEAKEDDPVQRTVSLWPTLKQTIGLQIHVSEDASTIDSVKTQIEPVQAERPDDFRKINGIGPKINSLLKEAGILTFQQLATTSRSDLETILEQAGPRFRLADPDDWAKQARELNQV